MREGIRNITLAGLVLFVVASNALATPISQSRVAVNVDWCSAGVSGIGGGSGIINLTCTSGTVTAAYLYWHGISSTQCNNANITVNGNPVTGTSLGDATTNCWGSGSSRGFEADVTGCPLVNESFIGLILDSAV